MSKGLLNAIHTVGVHIHTVRVFSVSCCTNSSVLRMYIHTYFISLNYHFLELPQESNEIAGSISMDGYCYVFTHAILKLLPRVCTLVFFIVQKHSSNTLDHKKCKYKKTIMNTQLLYICMTRKRYYCPLFVPLVVLS